MAAKAASARRRAAAAGPAAAADPSRLETLLSDLEEQARKAGAFLIARHQRLRQRRVQVTNGRVEDVGVAEVAGLGLHVFSRDGRSAFGSVDRVEAGPARQVLASLLGAVREAARRRHDFNREVWSLAATSEVVLPKAGYAFDHLPLDRLSRELLALNRAAASVRRGLKVETACTVRDEEWTVWRSDGTRSRFRMPRATAANHVTLEVAGGPPLSASASASTPSYELLLDEEPRLRLEHRSRRAIERIEKLATAPYFPAGSYPLVIDYQLAKGLAHEAFGHASEADSYGSSCLASRGRLRCGLEVAVPTLSIVDQPIFGDHAYQPVGANGGPRQRTAIVAGGRLHQGLSDVFSARRGGVPLVHAERAESYRSVPLPRMSNIRIEMSDARPLPRPFDDLEPEDVRDLLREHGLLEREPVVYLSGYRGGQVNTMRGDFVFNCGAIHRLGRDGVETFRPAIFSGHFLSAVGAVRAGFGPLLLDAIGTCGKAGQHVPSSGGANALLYLERRDDVKIGGRS